jgi:RNA polymerase sigma factor (sigma-70 family)
MDAEDVTQEVLIKLITNLSSYDPAKAQFRTWLYRISFNFILNYKKSNTERAILSFDQFFDFMEEIADDESVVDEVLNPVSNEAMIKCMTGMLMCVPREDRLLYIVGDFFEVDHNLGAELFQISKANFRKKLSRIRANLRQWMNNKCGLVNKDNPCRCARKTKGFIERGIVNPEKLIWDKGFSTRIEDFSQNKLDEVLIFSDKIYSRLYQKHPFKEGQTAEALIDSIVSDKNMREILNF